MTSHLGMVELSPVPPDTRRFWCTGVAADVLQSLATTVALRGSKLAQLAHPIGLSGPSDWGQPWIEFRRKVAGAFSVSPAGVAGGFPRAAIAARSTTSDRWYRALETNYGGELPASGWLVAGAEPAAGYGGTLETLDSDDTVRQWIGGALERLAGPAAVPAVEPPVPPVSTRTLGRVGTAAALLTAVGCGAHFASVSWTKASVQQQIQAIKQPAEEKKRMDDQLRQVNEQVAGLRTELATLQTQQSDLAALTARGDRFAELLRLVAAAQDENLVLDQIAAETSGLRLIGRTIDSEAAVKLAMRLTPQVDLLGWRVKAPELEGENKMLNGGPWSFRIDLVDTVVPLEGKPQRPPPAAVVQRTATFDGR
jgi:hypothetical protein